MTSALNHKRRKRDVNCIYHNKYKSHTSRFVTINAREWQCSAVKPHGGRRETKQRNHEMYSLIMNFFFTLWWGVFTRAIQKHSLSENNHLFLQGYEMQHLELDGYFFLSSRFFSALSASDLCVCVYVAGGGGYWLLLFWKSFVLVIPDCFFFLLFCQPVTGHNFTSKAGHKRYKSFPIFPLKDSSAKV